jgi:hypothetical protein
MTLEHLAYTMLACSENWPAQRKPHAPMLLLPVPVLHVLEPSLPGFRITDLPITKHPMIGHRRVVVPDTHVHVFKHARPHIISIYAIACAAHQVDCKALHPFDVDRDTRWRSSVCQCLIIQSS